MDYCSDCFVTQAQEKDHHSFEHIFLGYRVNIDYQAHSDGDCDDDEANQHTNDDISDDILQSINSPSDVSCDDKEIIPKIT